MIGTKKAPTGQVQGPTIKTTALYQTAPRLSTATEIILLTLQAPEHADRLRWACFERLDQVLRQHYTESRAGL